MKGTFLNVWFKKLKIDSYNEDKAVLSYGALIVIAKRHNTVKSE